MVLNMKEEPTMKLTFKITRELHKEFKIQCIRDEIAMADKIHELIAAYLKSKQRSKN